jgi:hypothetical protein
VHAPFRFDLGPKFSLNPTRSSPELDGQAAGGLPGHLLLPVRIRLTVMAIGHMLTSALRLGCLHGLAVA